MKYKLLSSAYYQGADIYEQLYHNRITSDATCKFEFDIKGNRAFVVITHEILQKMSTILGNDKTLAMMIDGLPSVALEQYAKRCLLDEIYLTNEIEGIQSTRQEISEILGIKSKPKEYRHLFGLVKKYEMLLSKTKLQLSSCENIRELYNDFVLEDVIKEHPENTPDGELFRLESVYVQRNGENIHRGILSEEKIIETLTQSLDMLNNEDYNFLIRIAIFHYMFGYIHPFYDGNGRMSRFISSYMLSQKLETLISCRLACAVKDKLAAYYKAFNTTNDEKNRGDMTYFVLIFFDIIIAAEEELLEALSERIDRLGFYHKLIEKVAVEKKISQLIFVLIQNTLFGNEGISISELVEVTGFGLSKVRKSMKELELLGLIKKSKKGNQYLYDLDLDALAKWHGHHEKPIC